MTENLLVKLEEKVLTLLAELESLRSEIQTLRSENNSLKGEKASSTDKLKELINQLDLLTSPSSYFDKSEHELYSERYTVPA